MTVVDPRATGVPRVRRAAGADTDTSRLQPTSFLAAEPFSRRHLGLGEQDRAAMLAVVGRADLDALIDAAVPPSIRQRTPLSLPAPVGERQALEQLAQRAGRNEVFTSLIGCGYYNTVTPTVILRNVLENPAWYTAYTPYQPEISQGRLEALLNFQTVVSELTGMDLANASMLDEATAAAEAMTLCRRASKHPSNVFLIDHDVHPATLEVIRTRAIPIGLEVRVADVAAELGGAGGDCFAVLVQYPTSSGAVRDLSGLCAAAHGRDALVVVAADLLALTLLQSPGAQGADVVVGTSQRFGVPMGFGGPHAGYLAVRDAQRRMLPGRLVGRSVDAAGRPALRLALQTREQHIRREKATSNICTAQVLLAVMASMYAVYHGPDGLRAIATRVHRCAAVTAAALRRAGYRLAPDTFFDTLTVICPDGTEALHAAATARRLNLRHVDRQRVGISFDETTDADVLIRVLAVFGITVDAAGLEELDRLTVDAIPAGMVRTDRYLAHPVFHSHRSETEMLRYLRQLADKDYALDRGMIALGSCTMKLNATTEMVPVTWPAFADLHPLAPAEQTKGYAQLIDELEAALCEITGYDAVSLQPNAGSQGELAGLLAIRAYHHSRGDTDRNVCLIPSSAHGTNAASAVMAGMKVVVVSCDEHGNVDLADLEAKAVAHSLQLAAVMVTYPSTHGVFEPGIVTLCDVVHRHGGQVYVDGANLNAMVGLAQPPSFGADVSHLNLHKTFCIPHGGGGPGVGPVAVRAHLAPFLPGSEAVPAISAASHGSASILPISWAYIRMMGAGGLADATRDAILSANYIAARLDEHYPVLYRGVGGAVAHECIIDLRPLTARYGVTVEDVAKRLMDYGLHAPTVAFPVAGTLMIEPTESESLMEIDRFCDAMIAIRHEIETDTSLLHHAPHTAEDLLMEPWDRSYSREQAAYPVPGLRANKYWPPVSRIDGAYGDRNLACSCAPIEAYQ
ncbi:MAG: aminomethyl-transferring glycine dehydrogenase [Acidimicrobiales bacterium]